MSWLSSLGANSPSAPPIEGDTQVARLAEQPVVLESALASAVGDGNDVIGLPSWSHRTPRLASGTIGSRWLRPRPFPMRFHDVESAQLTGTLIALFDLLAHVPRAAPDLPFVHAGVTAERPAWRSDGPAAPPADCLALFIFVWDAPLFGRHGPAASCAHRPCIGQTANSKQRTHLRALRYGGQAADQACVANSNPSRITSGGIAWPPSNSRKVTS